MSIRTIIKSIILAIFLPGIAFAGTFTYSDYSNRIVTLSGTGAETPSSFYTADLNGTLQLDPSTGSTSVSGTLSDQTLDRAIQPADYGALELTFVITNYSSSGSVVVTGTNPEGSTISETISISSAGNYTTSYSYTSVSDMDFTGTYDYYVRQNRWGVVWKTSGNSYTFDVGLKLSSSATFTIADQQVYCRYQTVGQSPRDYSFYVDNGCTLNVTRASLHSGLIASGDSFIVGVSGGTIDFDDSEFYLKTNATTYAYLIYMGDISTQNCLYNYKGSIFRNSSTIDFGNFNIFLGESGGVFNTPISNYGINPSVSMDSNGEVYSKNFKWGALWGNNSNTLTLYNWVFDTGSYLAYVTSGNEIKCVNPVLNSVTDKITGSTTGKVTLAYTFDPKFQDVAGNLLDGTVEISNSYHSYTKTFNSGYLGSAEVIVYGYYDVNNGNSLQEHENYTITITPTSGEVLSGTVDHNSSFDGGYIITKGVEEIHVPVSAIYQGQSGDTVTVYHAAISGSTVEIDIYDTGGTQIVDADMSEYIAGSGKYSYGWNTTGQSNGDDYLVEITDVNSGILTYAVVQLRERGSGSGGGLTYTQNELLESIASRTDEIDAIKAKTDMMQFDHSSHIYANTDEISVSGGGLTYTQNELLESIAARTDEIDAMNGSVEIMFHVTTGNQMIDNSSGVHKFYRVDSPNIIRQYQLLDQNGSPTINPTNAWGREDVTP